MADFKIDNLLGGMNNTDPSIAISDDQCVLAQNIEYFNSMLGDRRSGTSAITLPTAITTTDKVTFLHRHLPTSDESASELWVLGITGTSSATLVKKDTSWSTISIKDTPNVTGTAPFQWRAVTIHGKIHFAYDSDQDRLHVWDGSVMRRSGLAAPAAAPTGSDTGTGSFAGTRFYRVRYIVKSGSSILLRSEPSAVLTFTPSGTGTGVTVTKPASISESETHWELEASFDNVNFYVIATTAVATTTATDSTADVNGYATSFDLSEDIGDYDLIPSAKYLAADADRLIWAGSWENDIYASRVGWTPVYNSDGVGNDERFKTSTTPFKDLDTYKNGEITGLSNPVYGSIWVFKQRAIYKLVRTGKENDAYDAVLYTDKVGALPGSVIEGVDEQGSPCVFFIDYRQGPCRIGLEGLKRCGDDIRKTWETINVDAASVVSSCVFHPYKKQVIWSIATASSDIPNTCIVLHTTLSRTFADGVRKGWALWTGPLASALTMTLYADNIEDGTARSLSLVPFIGVVGSGFVHQCDTGEDDNGTSYVGLILSKPYVMKSLTGKFGIFSGTLLAKASTGATINLSVIRDFGLETTKTVTGISLTPTSTETDVIIDIDNLKGAALRVVQYKFSDPDSASAHWELNRLDVRQELGQQN